MSSDSSVIFSSWSLTPTHSRVGIVLCVAVVTFDLSGGWDLLISGRDSLVGSGCTLTLVSEGDILRNSPVCGENRLMIIILSGIEACLYIHTTKCVYILQYKLFILHKPL